MADQNITELPVKTSSGMTSSDYMLGIDSAEGYQMLIKDLGDYIIRNVQVNTIAGANQTLKSALDTLNSKTDVGITAAEGVQLSSTSKICVTGTYIFIYVKGKALETKTNAQLCTFGGNKNVYTACTVPIGIGDSEWDISSTGYCFISGKNIVGRVQENKWFHIFITIPFA